MTETTMDQREIESILDNLETAKADLLRQLDVICELLEDDNRSEKDRLDLIDERVDIEYEIHETELDIAMYTEMMNKLYPSEIGACGFPCDGRCQQCGGFESYDPSTEVFTGGDY